MSQTGRRSDGTTRVVEHVAGTSHPNRWSVLVVCCGGLFLLVSALTSLNVALPELQRDLGATTADLQWIIDAYGVVFGGLLLTGGSIGDRIGRRRALAIGFALVGLGGLIGGLAGSVGIVIVARVVTGLGGALLMPATLSTVTDVFDDETRGQAIASWSGVAGAGGAFGPAIGGWLIDSFSWQAVFWMNAVMATVGVIAVVVIVPRLPIARTDRLDPIGAALSTGAIGFVLFAIIEAPTYGLDLRVIVPGLVGVALGRAFVRHEATTESPMLPLRVFSSARRRRGLGTLLIVATGFAGVIFVGALLLQIGWGETALATGLLLLPIGVSELLVSAWSPRCCALFGTHRVITVGVAIMSVGYIGMAITPVGDRAMFVVAGLIAGVGNGLTIPASVERVVVDAETELAGVVAGVNETSIELGASLGVAVLGGAQRIMFADSLPEGVPDEVGAAIDQVGDVAIDAYVDGGRTALVVAAMLMIVAIPFAWGRRGAVDR